MSVPATSAPRNIIILLDGTANQFSDTNTNLIKTLSVLRADESQLVYYSSGIGTVLPDSTSTWSHWRQKMAQAVDMGLAWNFDEFVCDAYKFLMDFYRTGDKIYLFGFSRGAYTARALAGMIQRVGLLPAGNHNQITLAYEMYTSAEAGPDGKDQSVAYRRIFGRSRPVAVEFLGVWDTVSSIGGFDLPQLPFASGARSIKFFRHALALDERRARFAPEYWRCDDEETDLRKTVKHAKAKVAAAPNDPTAKEALATAEKSLKDHYPTTALTADKKELPKNVECWFMGCHSDVGGGNTKNDLPSLSNIPFRWMLREASQCGLLLDPAGFAGQSALAFIPPPPTATGPQLSDATVAALTRLRTLLDLQAHDPKCECEQEEEVEKLRKVLTQAELVKAIEMACVVDSKLGIVTKDEMADITESLQGAWYALEVLVLKTRHYTNKGSKEKDEYKINNGDSRQIVPGQKCHISVLHRLMHDYTEAKKGVKATYGGPAAKVAQDWPTWDAVRKGAEEGNQIWLA